MNFPGGNLMGGSFLGGNFPGESFPRTVFMILRNRKKMEGDKKIKETELNNSFFRFF